jgi:hypothetical protein
VNFGKDTALTIASGDVTYTGSMKFSGTDNTFKVENGSLSGTFGVTHIGDKKASLSGTLAVDTTDGLSLSGTLKAGTNVSLGVSYNYGDGVRKGTANDRVNGKTPDGVISPTLSLIYQWSNADEAGVLSPVLSI